MISPIFFYSFLLFSILVGVLLYVGYGQRINRFRDFLALNRSIGSVPLAITLITAGLPASALWWGVSDAALHGISNSITRVIYYGVSGLIFGHYIYPRLLVFPNTYTLGGVIKHMYGQLAGTITSLFASLVCCYFAFHHFISVSVASPFFTENRSIFLILVGTAAILQALWMSSHRISTTSIIQFVLMVVLLSALATIVLYLPKVKLAGSGLQGLLLALKHEPKIVYDQLVTYHPGWGSILNGFIFPAAFLSPPLIQRILINQDSQQVQNASWGFALFHIVFRCMLIIIGLGAALMIIPPKGTLITQFKLYFLAFFQHDRIGTLYLYLVLACSISVISYYLHSIAVELVQNVIKPYKKKPLKYDNRWIKWIILIIGIFCILCGLVAKKNYFTSFYLLLLFTTAILAPFIIGCIGLKGNIQMFIIGLVSFYGIALGLLLVNQYGYFPIKTGLPFYRRLARTVPIAILGSGAIILLVHYLTYYGFVQREEQKNNGLLKFRRRNRGDSFGKMLSNPLMWAREKFEKYENNPTIICTLLLFSLAVPNLAGNSYHPDLNLWTLLTIKIIGISLATIMMFHNFFPHFFKKIFPLLWFFTLGYCIPFYFGFEILCSPHTTLLIAKLLILLLLMRVFTDFRTFTVLTCLGLVGAYIAYVSFVPPHKTVFSFAEKWFIFELVILFIITTTTVITIQEYVTARRVNKNKSLASGYSHDLRNLFQYTNWMLAHHLNDESVMEVLKNRPETLKKDSKALEKVINVVGCISNYLKESLKESEVFYDLVCNDHINPADIKEIEMKEFIEQTLDYVPNIFRKDVKAVARKASKVVFHKTILRSTILNLIKNAFKHGLAKKVIIGWNDEENCLYVQDNGRGIPPEKQPYIFDLYYTTGGSGVGLSFSKNMLERINASIRFQTSPKGTLFSIHLPSQSIT